MYRVMSRGHPILIFSLHSFRARPPSASSSILLLSHLHHFLPSFFTSLCVLFVMVDKRHCRNQSVLASSMFNRTLCICEDSFQVVPHNTSTRVASVRPLDPAIRVGNCSVASVHSLRGVDLPHVIRRAHRLRQAIQSCSEASCNCFIGIYGSPEEEVWLRAVVKASRQRLLPDTRV